MLKVEEALKITLDNIKTLNAEEVNILDSLDRVLAEDIYSEIDIPAFDNSAMDGYAVRSLDTDGASFDSPKVLEVIEDIPAGCVPKKEVIQGSAVRIMTGAPIPEGADAVIMVEHTEQEGGWES
jgi:molybdopterin molybdotransferase